MAEPAHALALSQNLLVEPVPDYEQKGFFGTVVFTNGHVMESGSIILYYGASDAVICSARLMIGDVPGSLNGPLNT